MTKGRTPFKPAIDYDPNLTNSGKTADQTVKLKFGQWRYRATMVVVIGGNCTGMSVLHASLNAAWEDLPENDYGDKIMLMKNGKGDTLLIDDLPDEDALGNLLICAEIIGIKPHLKTKEKVHGKTSK